MENGINETIIDNSEQEQNNFGLSNLFKQKNDNQQLKEDKIKEMVVDRKTNLNNIKVSSNKPIDNSNNLNLFEKTNESKKIQAQQEQFLKNGGTIENKFDSNLEDESKKDSLVSWIQSINKEDDKLKKVNVSSNKTAEKLNISVLPETTQENTNKTMIEKLEEINRQKGLSSEQKSNIYTQFADASKLMEQKYNIKSLETPLSKTLDDQVNAIMNSNLKELGDTRSLKLYQSLNKDGKATQRHPELIGAIQANIKSVIEDYNTKVLNQNFNGLKTTYNTNDISNRNLLGRYPNELIKNVDGITTKEQTNWLQQNIKTSDLGTNLDNYSKENLGIFSQAQKDSIEDLKTMRNTVITSQKLVDEGKMDPNKLNYLKEAYSEASQMLNSSLLGTMKNMGYDVATIDMNNKLEQQRILETQNAQIALNQKLLEEKQAKELEDKSHPKVEDLFPDRGMN